MKVFRTRTGLLFTVLFALFMTGFGAGKEISIDLSKTLKDAEDLFELREDLTKNQEAIDLLTKTALEIEKTPAKYEPIQAYDLNILLAKALYWKGIWATDRKDQMEIFELSYEAAERSKKIGEKHPLNDRLASSYYLYGIGVARWAEKKGILEALNRKKELFDNLEWAIERETKGGDLGETLDGFGPDRVMGIAYFILPVFAGGSWAKAIKHLRFAWKNAPDYAINGQYLAEALAEGNKDDKAEACSILKHITSFKSKPEDLNPNRLPETKIEIENCENLYNKVCS